jgi:hypothetical protein
MKHKRHLMPHICHACLVLVTFLTLLSGFTAQGKLPELDVIYRGYVLHKSTQPFVPDASSSLSVIAKLDGVQIAAATMAAGQSLYLLKIPRDDGTEPRLPGTTRQGERVRLYLRKGATEYEVKESVSNSATLLIPVTKGSSLMQNISVDQNLGGSASPYTTAFFAWAATYGLAPIVGLDNLDRDGDGKSNYDEFLAGTSPTDKDDYLSFIEAPLLQNGIFSVKYGKVKPSRHYTIYKISPTDASQKIMVGEVSPDVAADFLWFDYVAVPGETDLKFFVEATLQ